MMLLKPIINFKLKILPLMHGNKRSKDKALIVAHKDLDGLISAYLLAYFIKNEYSRIDILFTQPGLNQITKNYLATPRIGNYKHICVVDLSLDFKNIESSMEFFNYLKKRLRFMFDHHIGWSREIPITKDYNIFINGERKSDSKVKKYIYLNESYSSCAHLIYDSLTFSRSDQFLQDLVTIANISDDLIFREKYQGTNIYNVFNVIKDNNMENNINTLNNTRDLSTLVHTKLKNWRRKEEKVISALKKSKEIYPGVCYISATRDENINYTLLSEYAYKSYDIIIIKQLDARQLKVSYIISHKLPELDLVEIFDLKGGNPRKICLCRKDIDTKSILEKIKPYLNKRSNELSDESTLH